MTIYGFVGIIAGRRYAKAVLYGALPWQKTALIAFAALLADSIYHAVFHRGLSPKSGFHPDALYKIPVRPDIADIQHIFFYFFPVLLSFALVRQFTGSLLAAIVLHALDNAIILFLAK